MAGFFVSGIRAMVSLSQGFRTTRGNGLWGRFPADRSQQLHPISKQSLGRCRSSCESELGHGRTCSDAKTTSVFRSEALLMHNKEAPPKRGSLQAEEPVILAVMLPTATGGIRWPEGFQPTERGLISTENAPSSSRNRQRHPWADTRGLADETSFPDRRGPRCYRNSCFVWDLPLSWSCFDEG